MGDPIDSTRVRLCNDPLVYVDQYASLITNRDTEKLATLVEGRFRERYLLSMTKEPRGGTGFALAALSCLTIEAIEGFRQGRPPHEVTGKTAFPAFFRRNPIMPAARVHCGYKGVRKNCSCFYHGVRCGILHMGETTGGWRVRNGDEPVYREDPDRIILNANKLQQVVRDDLARYVKQLRGATWTPREQDPLWAGFERRMEWTIKHCRKMPLGGEP